MISVKCQNCGKMLRAPNTAAGQSGKCRSCGTMISVPSLSKAIAGVSQDDAPITDVPSAIDNRVCPFCGETITILAKICRFCRMNLTQGQEAAATPHVADDAETVIWQGHPSYVAYLRHFLVAFLCLTFIGFAQYMTLAPLPALLAPVLVFYVVLHRKSTLYTITDQRAVTQSGIIGRKYSEVNLPDVRNITLSYGISERICRVGTIGIATAAGSGVEIEFKCVKDPRNVHAIVGYSRKKSLDAACII